MRMRVSVRVGSSIRVRVRARVRFRVRVRVIRVRVRVRVPGQRVALPSKSCSQQTPLVLTQPCPAPLEQQLLWHADQPLHDCPSGARVRVRVGVGVRVRTNE